jgi:hypothetical protein
MISQISFEHTYQNPSHFGETSDGLKANVFYSQAGLNYYTMECTYQTAYNCTISRYNQNHILIENIPILPDSKLLFITDKLFNNDDEVELVVSKKRMVTAPDVYQTNDIHVLDHQGNILYTFADRFDIHVLKDGNQYKLMLNSLKNTSYDIYSLQGYLSVEQEVSLNDNLIGYPIPANDILYISNNNLLAGENVQFEIYDSAGRKVLEHNEISDSKKIEINISSLQSGAYICKFENRAIRFIKK